MSKLHTRNTFAWDAAHGQDGRPTNTDNHDTCPDKDFAAKQYGPLSRMLRHHAKLTARRAFRTARLEPNVRHVGIEPGSWRKVTGAKLQVQRLPHSTKK